MNTEYQAKQPKISSAEIDDAAVWMARLRAPDRSLGVEKGFQRWVAENPRHAAAFEIISSAWELTGAIKRRPFPKLSRWERAGFRAGFLQAGAAVAAIVAISLLVYLKQNGIATGTGEQRVLNLEDGTRVMLNTATKVRIDYDDRVRHVRLVRGEALFDVAKQSERPFIVTALDREIRALGTSFVVREHRQQLTVTLIEGKVMVTPETPSSKEAQNPNSSSEIALSAGQRLTLSRDKMVRLDQPVLESYTAWRRGQIEFNDTPLAEAIAEVNRYSDTKLVVSFPEATQLRINGIFRTGDTTGFAAALSRSYGLTTERQGRVLTVEKKPIENILH